MLTDDEITSAYYLYDAEDQNDFKTLSRAEQRLKTAIRLARWAYEKGKNDDMITISNTGEVRSGMSEVAINPEKILQEIEQARASCLNECAGCHEKKFATIPFCQRCIVKKEASIRADERRKMEDKHMSQKRDWYDDGYAKGKEEGSGFTEQKKIGQRWFIRREINNDGSGSIMAGENLGLLMMFREKLYYGSMSARQAAKIYKKVRTVSDIKELVYRGIIY